ncbi:hypothetical protein [Phyllobacterium sophorae]
MRALDGSWWRPDPDVLAEAKHDAALLALYEQERAGLDLVNDGEAQRASYDRHFLKCLTGIDYTHPDHITTSSEVTSFKTDSTGLDEYFSNSATKARVVSEISWAGPLTVDELEFTKAHASRPVKANLVGPITLAGQVSDHAYGDEKALVIAIAKALHQELLALQNAGADVLQIDEPYFQTRLSAARKYGREAIETLVKSIEVPVIVHVCYGYALAHKIKKVSPTYPEVLEILADCPIQGISLEYGNRNTIQTSCAIAGLNTSYLDCWIWRTGKSRPRNMLTTGCACDRSSRAPPSMFGLRHVELAAAGRFRKGQRPRRWDKSRAPTNLKTRTASVRYNQCRAGLTSQKEEPCRLNVKNRSISIAASFFTGRTRWSITASSICRVSSRRTRPLPEPNRRKTF